MNEVVKNRLKRFLNAFGLRFIKAKHYKFSYDRENFENFKKTDRLVIFDVGANIGQSSLWFHDSFPNATIHAFEPFPVIFAHLTKNTGHVNNVKRHQIALGDGEKTLNVPKVMDPLCQTAQVVESSRSEQNTNKSMDLITVRTVDNFCEENSIEKIDILKTDTEGFDLNVLSGAKKLLEKGRIQYILSEVSIIPEDQQHTDLFELRNALAPYNFTLFSLYDIVHNPATGRLEYFNAIFKKN